MKKLNLINWRIVLFFICLIFLVTTSVAQTYHEINVTDNRENQYRVRVSDDSVSTRNSSYRVNDTVDFNQLINAFPNLNMKFLMFPLWMWLLAIPFIVFIIKFIRMFIINEDVFKHEEKEDEEANEETREQLKARCDKLLGEHGLSILGPPDKPKPKFEPPKSTPKKSFDPNEKTEFD